MLLATKCPYCKGYNTVQGDTGTRWVHCTGCTEDYITVTVMIPKITSYKTIKGERDDKEQSV